MEMFKNILFVGLGSFTGGALRYIISKIINSYTTTPFPFGTFAVNVLGCLAIGILYGLFERGNLMNPYVRLFLTVGFCGGFTTFSTFMNENFQLIKMENFLYLSLYAGLSLVVGLLMVYIGNILIKSL